MMIRLLPFITIAALLPACDRQPASTPSPQPAAYVEHESAALHTIHFRVYGMDCDGCANGLKALLAEIPGVVSADASYPDSSATITTADPSIAEEVRAAILDLEYEVEIISAETPASE